MFEEITKDTLFVKKSNLANFRTPFKVFLQSFRENYEEKVLRLIFSWFLHREIYVHAEMKKNHYNCLYQLFKFAKIKNKTKI